MIKVKHPIPECNIEQDQLIATLPQEKKRFMSLLFTHGNIVYRYHQKSKDLNPTKQDWKDWLNGLPQNIRQQMEKDGFEKCLTYLPFTRFLMEVNDMGLEEYIQKYMEPEDYREFMSQFSQNQDSV
ncbi:hypothetical protein QNI19_32260 [Cytophagaceae bacterium DM2B3-1]|uniref:Uncharacterized protein n=1 Tax=Xanthocytophaga flava TaxID=3048013 RepID=A0ABT7CV65_9BACT|nr:hypothetical protein [Xanthocytophaga flavus]MDJ1497658.1 hypothetical protein [Xanthocytophaga flavus]